MRHRCHILRLLAAASLAVLLPLRAFAQTGFDRQNSVWNALVKKNVRWVPYGKQRCVDSIDFAADHSAYTGVGC